MKNLLNPSELINIITNKNIIILDASQDGKAAGMSTKHPNLMIEGARFFDIKNIFSDTTSGLPNTFPSNELFEKECRKLGINNDSEIVVYDNIGLFSSPRVWWMFIAMGHQNIRVLNAGLEGWIKEGYPTVERNTFLQFETGDFKSQLDTTKIRYKEDILLNIESQKEVVIDARGKQRFDGTVEEPRVGMKSGHIPNSFNIPFKTLLNDGYLKSEEELRAIFQKIVPQNKKLVFTCGSGITACIVHLAASEISDVPMAIYDGSWSEWGASDNPIVKN